MSKSVLGLLAGLAVVAAAGRVKRGSFAKRYTVYARTAVEARAKFAKDHPHLHVLGSEVDEKYGSAPGLPDLSGYYEYIITAEPKGSRAHDEDKRFGTYTFGLTPQKAIEQAVAHHVGEAGTYPIEAHQGTEMLSYLFDANKVAGIHPFRFQGRHGRVGLRYTGDELVKLLAALKKLDDEHEHDEDEDDSPGMVRSSILGTLGIEEV